VAITIEEQKNPLFPYFSLFDFFTTIKEEKIFLLLLKNNNNLFFHHLKILHTSIEIPFQYTHYHIF